MSKFIKVLVLLLTLFLSVGSVLCQSTNRSKLSIINASGSSVTIQNEFNPNICFDGLLRTYASETVEFDANSPFRLVCRNIDKNNEYIYTTIWINPNENIYLKGSALSTVAYVKGNQVRNNELAFFNKMQKVLGNFEGLFSYIPHKRKFPDLLLIKLTDLYNQRLNFLESYKKTNPISKKFEAFLKKAFYYRMYYDFFDYCQLEGILNKELYANNQIKEFIDKLTYSEEDDDLIYFQEAYFYKIFLEYKDDYDYYEIYFRLKLKLSGKTKELVLYKVLDYAYKSPQIGELTADFINSDFSIPIKKRVEKKYGDFVGKIEKLTPQNYDKTNTTLLYNLKSQTFITWDSLLKTNEVKFIDFWATWCGGCRQAIPNSKAIQKGFDEKKFKVIYISIDENVTAWGKISRKEGLADENSYLLIDQEFSKLKKDFTISSIPRYMLIDRNGKIVDSNISIYSQSVSSSIKMLLEQ